MPADQTISSPISFLGCSVANFNATMGFNGSPSTLDVQLVEDDNQNFPAHNSRPNPYLNESAVIGSILGGAQHSNGNPGTYKKFVAQGFTFGGVVTSWRRNHSPNGRYINVQLSDPRIFLKEIPVITDHYPTSAGGSDPYNSFQVSTPLLDFANPVAAAWTSDGLIFRNYLHSHFQALRFTFFGTRYSIVFDSSFINNVAFNYRPPMQNSTIEELINRTASDNNMDWYVDCQTEEADVGGLNGVVITIKGLYRKNQFVFGNSSINNFITSTIGTDKITSYEIGRELRTDPSRTVFVGDNKRTFVQRFGNQITPIFQVTSDGYLCDQPLIDLSNVHSESAALVDGLPSLTIPNLSVNIVGGTVTTNSVNPFTTSKFSSSRTIKGYPANEYILRAALHGKDAWATCVWYAFRYIYGSFSYNLFSGFHSAKFITNPTNSSFTITDLSLIPIKMGIFAPPFDREKANFSDVPSTYGLGTPTPQTEALKEACYQATLKMAQEYYGKTFVIYLGDDAGVQSIQNSGGSYSYWGKKIPTVYEICDAAPDINDQISESTVSTMTSVHRKTDSGAFRTDKGLYRPFAALKFYNIKGIAPNARLDNLDPSAYIKADTLGTGIATNSNTELIRADISVEQYKFDPRYALVTFNEPLYLGNFQYYKPGSSTPSSEYNYTLYSTTSTTDPALIGRTQSFTTKPQVLKPLTKKDKTGGTREFLHFIYSDYTVRAISSASQKEIDDSSKLIEAKVFQDMLDHRSKIWQEKIGFAEARLVDTTDMQISVPLKWNFLRYGPFFGTSTVSDRPTQVVQDTTLSPWGYGSVSNMYAAGNILADNSTGAVSTIGYASVTAAGMPDYSFGYTLTGVGSPAPIVATLSEVSMSYGINGFTTTYRFKTFFGPTGFLKKSEIDSSTANTFRVSEVKRDIIKLDSLVKDYEPESGKRFTFIDRSKSVLSSAITSGGDKTSAADGSYLMAGGNSTANGKVNVAIIGGGAVKEMFEGSSDTYPQSVFCSLGEMFTPVGGNYSENIQNGQPGIVPSIHGIPIGGPAAFVPNANPDEVTIKYSPVLDPEEFDSTISLPEA